MSSLLRILADDRRSIVYRPRLNAKTGGVLATILFQQILFRWEQNGCRPFYKFAAPPGKPNKHYRPGDSWQEELGFSRYEFESARRQIAVPVDNRQNKDEVLARYAIVYWRDHQNLTWYEVNVALTEALILDAYSNAEFQQPEIANAGIQQPRMLDSSNLSNAGFQQQTGMLDSSIPISENKNPESGAEKESLNKHNGSRAPEIVWQTAYEELRLQMPRDAFDAWLKGARLSEVRGDCYVLEAPNVYAREWLEHRLRSTIVRTLSYAAGREVEIEFIVTEDAADSVDMEGA